MRYFGALKGVSDYDKINYVDWVQANREDKEKHFSFSKKNDYLLGIIYWKLELLEGKCGGGNVWTGKFRVS